MLWRKNYFVLGRIEQLRQDKNLLYQHDEPNKQIIEGRLSYVPLESPIRLSFNSRQRPPHLHIVPLGGSMPLYFHFLVIAHMHLNKIFPHAFAQSEGPPWGASWAEIRTWNGLSGLQPLDALTLATPSWLRSTLTWQRRTLSKLRSTLT